MWCHTSIMDRSFSLSFLELSAARWRESFDIWVGDCYAHCCVCSKDNYVAWTVLTAEQLKVWDIHNMAINSMMACLRANIWKIWIEVFTLQPGIIPLLSYKHTCSQSVSLSCLNFRHLFDLIFSVENVSVCRCMSCDFCALIYFWCTLSFPSLDAFSRRTAPCDIHSVTHNLHRVFLHAPRLLTNMIHHRLSLLHGPLWRIS